MPSLVIIRGLPGSGKSTTARDCFGMYNHFEADSYHTVDGTYIYNPLNIKKAHEVCYYQVRRSLKEGYDTVVANTFTTIREMKRYYNLRNHIANLDITIYECTGQFGSIHNVPESKMLSMARRWQIIPSNWNVHFIECNQ